MRSIHLSVQRQLLKYVRAEIRNLLGHQSKEVLNYYRTYKRELQKLVHSKHPYEVLDKSKLIHICSKATLILLGDYHSFKQSQRTALRLLRDLIEVKKNIIIGIEFIKDTDQGILNQYLAEEITEEDLLSHIEYQKNWGFSWLSYVALLEFAKENKLSVLALNTENQTLKDRDATVAKLISKSCEDNPEHLHFVLYGDLHLAKPHLPSFLKKQNPTVFNRRNQTVIIFQNSEALYWDLAKRGLDHSAEVIKFSSQRFCIQNATPWVKLQSYLDWAESRSDNEVELLETKSHVEHAESIQHKSHTLSQSLTLNEYKSTSFEIFFPSDMDRIDQVLKDTTWSAIERKTLTLCLIGQLPLYLSRQQLLYLPSSNINKINEAAARILHLDISRTSPIFGNPLENPYSIIVQNILGYFGSKILNPKRKCNLEQDLVSLSKDSLTKSALPQERIIKTASQYALKYIKYSKRIQDSLKTKKTAQRLQTLLEKQSLLNFPNTGRSRMSLFLESTRSYGMFVGESLYEAFSEESVTVDDIRRIFRMNLNDSERARKAWLDILELTKNSEPQTLTKRNLL